MLDQLGEFDLDPCAAWPRPWDCAHANRTKLGLDAPWFGLVWLNPPFHRYQVAPWVEKLATHGSGIALLHARTETSWFAPCWRKASAILFMADRIKFCRPDGTEQPANSGAPPVLVAFGDLAKARLKNSKIPGAFVTDWFIQP